MLVRIFHQRERSVNPLPLKNSKSSLLRGRLVQTLNKAMGTFYQLTVSNLAKWAASFFAKIPKTSASKEAERRYREEAGASPLVVFQRGGAPIVQELKKAEEQATLILELQKAEEEYLTQERAVTQMFRSQVPGTIALISHHATQFKYFQQEFQEHFTEDQKSAFSRELQTLEKFLKGETKVLKQSLKETRPLRYAEVRDHLQIIFEQANTFYEPVKKWAGLFEKGSPGKKKFLALAKGFVSQLKTQNNIYQTPSSHQKILFHQQEKQKAWQFWKALRERQESITN